MYLGENGDLKSGRREDSAVCDTGKVDGAARDGQDILGYGLIIFIPQFVCIFLPAFFRDGAE